MRTLLLRLLLGLLGVLATACGGGAADEPPARGGIDPVRCALSPAECR